MEDFRGLVLGATTNRRTVGSRRRARRRRRGRAGAHPRELRWDDQGASRRLHPVAGALAIVPFAVAALALLM
jgi:hypothetical protein